MDFEPSAGRGLALDQQMRARLADTLDYIFSELGSELKIDGSDATSLTSRIRTRRQSANFFGIYYDLVLSIERGDLEGARELVRELLSQDEPAGFKIGTVESRNPIQIDRLRRLLMEGLEMATEPDAALYEATTHRIEQAFNLLDRGYPEMAAEIRELLSEIVVAAGPEDPKAMTFDGASSYMMWGATLLNCRGQNNVLDTAQALAHESGHNLLFGFCSSGSLVENPDEELFSSPLRKDPRPMDGVFHATYVIARMHQTLGHLVDSGVLNERQRTAALADLTAHRRNFEVGDQVIREGARLTPLGAEVIESARAYMGSAAELV